MQMLRMGRMAEWKLPCYLCGKTIRGVKETPDAKYLMFDITNNSVHEHIVISTSQILSNKYYPDDEDKTKTIGEMTITEFENRVKRLATAESAKRLGSYLHAHHGYISRGFDLDNIKKNIEIDGNEYFITGKLDAKENDMIVEAKFPSSKRSLKKIRNYAIDQCDIYGWITDIPKSKIIIHIIDENKDSEEIHLNKFKNGESLIVQYIKNNFP